MSDVKAGLGAKVGSFLSNWGDNTANGGVSEGSASNPMFNAIGSMAGSLITSGGGDQNNAQGVTTAISQAPDMFKAIKNFDASSLPIVDLPTPGNPIKYIFIYLTTHQYLFLLKYILQVFLYHQIQLVE